MKPIFFSDFEEDTYNTNITRSVSVCFWGGANVNILQKKVVNFISRKPIYSNYFGIDLEKVEYIECSDTLLLRKPYETFSRIYFLSTNANQLIDLLRTLSADDIINIPSKNGLSSSLLQTLSAGGYSLFETYVRLYNNNSESRDKFVDDCFARIEDVPIMYHILYANFCPYTDTLPSKDELTNMVLNKQLIVCRNEREEVTGLVAFTLMKSRCYFSILINVGGGATDGLNLLFKGFDYIASKNITQYYLWAKETNHRAVNLYFALGCKLDGLKDYTFIKQEKNETENKADAHG
ncbi:hypothetical protein FACS1894199_03470 [Bacteroidia bacterium]|nr:hypothetical protein FACS1894199_03470 [Bacteroidia bacterium]